MPRTVAILQMMLHHGRPQNANIPSTRETLQEAGFLAKKSCCAVAIDCQFVISMSLTFYTKGQGKSALDTNAEPWTTRGRHAKSYHVIRHSNARLLLTFNQICGNADPRAE